MATINLVTSSSKFNNGNNSNNLNNGPNLVLDVGNHRNSIQRDASKASADDYEQHELRDHDDGPDGRGSRRRHSEGS